MAFSPEHRLKFMRFSGRSLARYISHVRATSTMVIEPANAEQVILDNDPFIFAMWHGQFLMQPALYTGQVRVSAIVARHGDAEIIGEVLERFDIKLVRGAGAGTRKKDRGGTFAMRTALKTLAGGGTFAMTADVPPGPARRSGDGIVTIARMSGRPIVPFAAATSRYTTLKTWSRMTINLPYGKLAYVVGEPIWVPRDADPETLDVYRRQIDAGLNAVTARAYELVGANPKRATPPIARVTGDAQIEPGLRLKGYRAVTSMLRPIAPALIAYRARQGKEDTARRNERFGIASVSRPDGQLVWIHAASVGETNAVLPLITRMLRDRPNLRFVLTTGTVTSAQMSAKRLPPQAIHQYVPLDAAAYARRFLDHWRPDLVLFTESEVWPNLILETSARGIPMALINARMSTRSFKRWSKSTGLSLPIFGRFDAVLAQNETLARHFRLLGVRNSQATGNLKIDSPPPPADPEKLEALRKALAGRPVFVAASTHEGEEAMVANSHRQLAREIPGLCTIIAPRHPERGTGVTEQIKGLGLTVAQRSMGVLPNERTDIYVADTIGELGTLYALSPVSFVGGSLIERGGQNPIEPVGHGSAVLTGPHWQNFKDTYTTLLRLKGVIEVRTSQDIAAAVAKLYRDPEALEQLRAGATAAMATMGGALERTVTALEPFLAKSDPSSATESSVIQKRVSRAT
jgi:3-deoxy-D-manno-octulosonic-acid transferase